MSLKTLALAGLLSLGATCAFADTISASLVSPVAQPTKFIAGDAAWACSGSTCVSANAPDDTLTAGACRLLTKEVGAVKTYGSADSLSTSELSRCNAGRAGAMVATAH